MEDDVDTPDCVDLDGDVDMERDGDNDEEEDEEEEDEEEEDEEKEDDEVEEEYEVEEEDQDEDNGKEPWTIGQGEMVNTSADDADTMVENEPTVLPEQGQKMNEHTPRPQPLAPAPCSQSPGASPTTMNSVDLYPQWAGVFGASDAAKTSPSGDNSARSWGSRKYLGCRCGAAATRQIVRLQQCRRCPSPGCPSPGSPSPG